MSKSSEDPTSTSLSKSVSDQILNPSFDLSQDYAELFLDDFIENEFLKEIPIVKSVVGVARIGASISNLFYLKKILTFIRELHVGNIDAEKLSEFRTKFNDDSKFRKKITEQIIVFNDRFSTIEKSKISARLLQAFIEGKFNYEEFSNLLIYLDQLHPKSYAFLSQLEGENFEIKSSRERNQSRDWDAEALLLSSGIAAETSGFASGMRLTQTGKNLYLCGIKPLLEKKE